MTSDVYFAELDQRTQVANDVAKKARALGKEHSTVPEIYLAQTLAEKVEGLVEIPGVASEIRKLAERGLAEEATAFELVRFILRDQKNREKGADQALRAGLAYLTQAAVSAPLEGIARVKIKRNADNTEYLAVYYAGPIRAAGGTAEALSVVVADFIRKELGLARYKPTSDEVGRTAEEIEWYHRYTHLQYKPSQAEVEFIIKNLAICVDGEPTEKYEVAQYRNLGRVETNRVRGGMCLVLAEGVAQKAPKLLKRMPPLEADYGLDWTWLNDLIKLKSASVTKEDTTKDQGPPPTSRKFIQEVPAGRPVFSHPSARGGFALRYGRTRASGYSAVATNPATMLIVDNFIAVGTQIRLEMPGKAAIVTPCDTIEGPLVRLTDGTVLRVSTEEEAERVKPDVEAILDLGDLLVSAGDFLENNEVLRPGAYVEEWWASEFQQTGSKLSKSLQATTQIPFPTPDYAELVAYCKEYASPMHPQYTPAWHDLTPQDIPALSKALPVERPAEDQLHALTNTPEQKRRLEFAAIPHHLDGGNIILSAPWPSVLWDQLRTTNDAQLEDTALATVQRRAPFPVRARRPTTIGARMGRPEKAKPRKTIPAPHALFPTGQRLGRIRDLRKITKEVETEIARYICPKCRKPSVFPACERCNTRTEIRVTCTSCGRSAPTEVCPGCGAKMSSFEKKFVNFPVLLDAASKNIGEPLPKAIKAILGMTSLSKMPEQLEKGILRAKHNVFAFKDGTIRFDSTNAPLTHVTPEEIGTSVEKMRDLGYATDYQGNSLERADQRVELLPQDIILSSFGDQDLSAHEYLFRVANFVDDLLEKFYKLPRYYNLTKPEELVGQLIIALAPHTSTGIVGRIIGFTNTRVCYAHPAFHAAKRRDADGDEDAVMLLMDALLNFSRAFLPSTRGGRMDAPLVVTSKLDLHEVDDEVYDVDTHWNYPLEFYNAGVKYTPPNKANIQTVKKKLDQEYPFTDWGFTYRTENIGAGVVQNTYTEGDMLEKLDRQLALADKIRAVDAKDVAERILRSHFIPDMRGNLRTFARQKVRCTKCNAKYRRVPLRGVCTRCSSKLTLTVHPGSIKKYLDVSKRMAEQYDISRYIRQQIRMMDESIFSLFGAPPQKTLAAFPTEVE